MADNELITIIVPVYNGMPYLKDCLDSLVSQTYQNLEILLVDNGSDDGSGELCKEYSLRYPQIRVIEEGIRQQGRARNRALEEMKGEYYTFVDADDYISENYVKSLYDTIKEYNCDLVQCGAVYMLECRDALKNCDHSVYRIEKESDLPHSVWGKLYKSSVYSSARFSDSRMGSDTPYINDICKLSTNAVIYSYCLYGYRSYQGSVTRIIPNKDFFEKLDKFIADKNEKEYQHIIQKCIQVVSHRHEEQLYHKQLFLLQKKTDQAQSLGISLDPSIEDKLSSMIAKSKVGTFKYIYLKLKQLYTTCIANYRQKINYHYHLE